MMNVPLFKVYTNEADVEAVAKVIRRGEWWANGPEIEQFEEKIADYVGTKYAVAFNSGTSALHAALLALGIGKGNEVIVPSFTFPATANMVVAVGAKPVFAEIEEETYGLEFKDTAAVLSDSTRAIMPVHYGGCLASGTKEIAAITNWRGVHLIEDAAESLGAVGLTGSMAMFSLCAPKVITTGEGGVLVTNSQAHYEALIRFRNHGGMTPDGWEIMGYNWRMSSITAALAISQLDKIEDAIRLRRQNALYLTEELLGLDIAMGGVPLTPPTLYHGHVFQMYTIRVKEQYRDPLLKHLNDNGIGAKVYFPCVHLMPLYRQQGWKEGDLPVTEQISKEVITLPMYPDLTAEEMNYIVDMITEYFSADV